MPLYADIVLPLAQPTFTYAVGEEAEISEGDVVAVELGRGKIYAGIVWRIHSETPPYSRIKFVGRKLYPKELLSAENRAFWEWTSSYYLASLGEVMRVAIPAPLKPSARGEEDFVRQEYRAKTERVVRLADPNCDVESLLAHLARRAKKRCEAVRQVADSRSAEHPAGCVARADMAVSGAVVAALVAEGTLCVEQRSISLVREFADMGLLPQLTEAQQEAQHALRREIERCGVALLFGVTGSGKTEIYIHNIARHLAAGRDVLMLVPEIAITWQLVERMRTVFGSRVKLFHSKISARRRSEIFMEMGSSEGGNLLIGARSAVFAPLRRLGLVVVDEEHDTSYKQTDLSPRYNARDAAIVMGRIYGAEVILGSATPSVESYANARFGKYGLVELRERYGSAQMPQLYISDTIRAARRGERRGHLNKILTDKIAERLERKEQVILFQNRRGFAPYVECGECHWTPRCPNCNVTLSYHKSDNSLRCHYCGHSEPLPRRCPNCKTTEPVPMGFGTEKIEEELLRLFPTARVARLDRDTASSEGAYSRIVEQIASGAVDIAVGTQMISKGFDFERVTLVGVLNADNLLHIPDFRSAERAMQTLMQVAGRAGRRDSVGEVVIQTSEPDNPIFGRLLDDDYESMLLSMLPEREAFGYPPYSRLTKINLRGEELPLVGRCASEVGAALREVFAGRVLGPVAPAVDKIRGEYLAEILVKVELGASSSRARDIIRQRVEQVAKQPVFRKIGYVIDVDPQ